ALRRPRVDELVENALAELVSGTRERECHVGMEALQMLGRSRAADAGVEGSSAVRIVAVSRELTPDPTLIRGRARERLGQRTTGQGRRAPPLDPAGGLDTRDGGDEVRTRDVVRRRERLAMRVVRRLLRDGREAVRTADDDTPEGTRCPAELLRD